MAIKTLISGGANPIGERLRLEMKKRGMTSVDLAKRADVKMSFIYDVISGKSANPSTVKLARVADVLGVNLNYLAGHTNDPAPVHSPYVSRSDEGPYVSVPHVSIDISANGAAVASQENEGEDYHFHRSWIRDHLRAQESDLRMMQVRGDSMVPTLCNGDMVLVDTGKKMPTPPGIFLLFDGFGLVAKRLEMVSESGRKRLSIMSDNPQYQTYERGVDETLIIGRVVWFAREI